MFEFVYWFETSAFGGRLKSCGRPIAGPPTIANGKIGLELWIMTCFVCQALVLNPIPSPPQKKHPELFNIVGYLFRTPPHPNLTL